MLMMMAFKSKIMEFEFSELFFQSVFRSNILQNCLDLCLDAKLCDTGGGDGAQINTISVYFVVSSHYKEKTFFLFNLILFRLQ